MQTWGSRRSICIHCLFGLSKSAPTRTRTRTRQFGVAITRAGRTPDEPRTQDGGPLVRRTIGKTGRAGIVKAKGSGQFRLPPSDLDLSEDALKKRLNWCLRTLQKRLTERDEGNKDIEAPLESLDPEGTRWPKFEQEVQQTLFPEKSSINQEGSRKKFRQRLWPLLIANDWRSESTRCIHFAFLDRVLAEQGIEVDPAAASVVDMRYPTEWYAETRTHQRDIHLHIGPTNSGKTYNALKRLEEAKTGFYAGPLRLLAHEVYSRFNAKGLRCDLVTGDDIRVGTDGEGRAPRTSMTVEMVSTGLPVEVAVIDEIQMMASEDRGWAWTRAVLGAKAKELHLCGEARVLPLVQELAASMGDNLFVHNYKRLNPLKAMSRSLGGNFKNLRKGDCVVTFSIVTIHALKKQIEKETGRRVAIVYGSLPPETRAQQAELFNNPDNDFDYLVASDAIGMGLNLSIKRIIFESTTKYNGTTRERLSIPQLKQIAGRAGRFRTARDDKASITTSPEKEKSIGLVTSLADGDLAYIRDALNTEAPPMHAAGILPPVNFVEEYAARLPNGVSFDYILSRLCEVAATHPRFMLCEIRDQLAIGRCIEPLLRLTIADRCQIAAAPTNVRTPEAANVLKALARCIADKREVTIVDLAEIPLELLDQPLSPDRSYLATLEELHKAIILFLWLSYRFEAFFQDRDMAVHAKELCEQKINTYLMTFSANPKLMKKLQKMRKMQALEQSQLAEEQDRASSIEKDFREGDVQENYVDEDRPDALPEDEVKESDTPHIDEEELEMGRARSSMDAPVFHHDYEPAGRQQEHTGNA